MNTPVKQNEQLKKSVFDFEEVVSEIEEAMALAYFVYEAQKDEYLDGKAVRGIYHLLERLSEQVSELFNVACDVERELHRVTELQKEAKK